MTQETEIFLKDEQKSALMGLVEAANDDLVAAASVSANRAFNLGFLVGIIPACALITGTFILTRFSWVGSFVMLILMVLALVLSANVIASIARSNAIKRLFLETIQPQLQEQLLESDLTERQFALICHETLPPGSPLLQFYPPPAPADSDIETQAAASQEAGGGRN